MQPHGPVPLQEAEAARRRLSDLVVRTPLLRLPLEDAPAEIFLKPENLQPIGSFKLRGAGNAMRRLVPEQLHQGVWTASAGNMGQGVAWCARQLGVACAVVVPEHAPATKVRALERLTAKVVKVPFESWLAVFREGNMEGMVGTFVHPFSDPVVMAGNATIGLELLEDLPSVDAVVIPYGGGGLACGVASVLRALRPETRIYACEVATAAPLAASLAAGEPVAVAYRPSFVDGIGASQVFPEMFGMARELLDGSLVVGPEQVAGAVRVLAERARIVAEGAGAAPLAAALAGLAGAGKVVCIVSGGNIDSAVLAAILSGTVPGRPSG